MGAEPPATQRCLGGRRLCEARHLVDYVEYDDEYRFWPLGTGMGMPDPRNPSMVGHSGRQCPLLWARIPSRHLAVIDVAPGRPHTYTDEDVVSQQPQSCQHG